MAHAALHRGVRIAVFALVVSPWLLAAVGQTGYGIYLYCVAGLLILVEVAMIERDMLGAAEYYRESFEARHAKAEAKGWVNPHPDRDPVARHARIQWAWGAIITALAVIGFLLGYR